MEKWQRIEASLLKNSECPMPSIPVETQRWRTLCQRYPLLWRLCSPTLSECPPPAAMNYEGFRQLVGTLRDPRYRPILAELLLELLGPELVKLLTLSKKRRRK